MLLIFKSYEIKSFLSEHHGGVAVYISGGVRCVLLGTGTVCRYVLFGTGTVRR